jgi:hypothetical protein
LKSVNRLSAILAGTVIALTASAVRAQSFFGGGVVAYDPEISTVNNGALLKATVAVSHDNKYVKFSTEATDSRLLSLRNFPVVATGPQGPAQGFVGGVNPGGANANAGGGLGVAPLVASDSPEEIDRRAVAARSILQRRGMFLLRVN